MDPHLPEREGHLCVNHMEFANQSTWHWIIDIWVFTSDIPGVIDPKKYAPTLMFRAQWELDSYKNL